MFIFFTQRTSRTLARTLATFRHALHNIEEYLLRLVKLYQTNLPAVYVTIFFKKVTHDIISSYFSNIHDYKSELSSMNISVCTLKQKFDLYYDWTKWRKFHLSVYYTWLSSRPSTARPGTTRPKNQSRFCEANNFFLFLHRMSWNFA